MLCEYCLKVEQQKGLATATAGGLLSSLSLFLFVAPSSTLSPKYFNTALQKGERLSFHCWVMLKVGNLKKKLNLYFFSVLILDSDLLPFFIVGVIHEGAGSLRKFLSQEENLKNALVLHICINVTAIKRRLRK